MNRSEKYRRCLPGFRYKKILIFSALILLLSLSGLGCSSQDSPAHSEETVMEQITSNDETVIRYKRSGSGPPLILVHGTTASHQRWASITPRFEMYRRLPMWEERVKIEPTIPREMEIELTYTFDPQRFSGLDIPVLLLLGGDSPPIFQQATGMIDSALPNSQIVVLPGQQHIAMDTSPELFAKEVMAFLDEEK